MEQVSEAWIEAQLQDIVPISYIEITYNIGDPMAQADASTSGETTSYGNVAQVATQVDKNYLPYATLEHNHWVLDGTFDIYSDEPIQDTGYVSSVICNSQGIFETIPILKMNFTEVHTKSVAGLTITWSETFDECARAFRVTAYNENEVIGTKTVTDNVDNVSIVEIDLINYNRIEIEILEWCLPLKRARMEGIFVGREKVFTKTDLIKYTHEQYSDIVTGDLPKNSIVFEIDNSDQQYNPDNPQGIYKYLLERQTLTVRYGYKIGENIEWIKGGTFYTSEWNAPQNGITAEFTARDLLEFMTDKFVKSANSVTLYDLATQALTQANLPLNDDGSNKWIIDSSLQNTTVTLPDDFNRTLGEVLQLVANAGMCVLYQDRNGILHIEKINETLTNYVINRFNSYQNADYEITKELKSVDINDGMGIATNAENGEIQTVSNELIQNSTVAGNVAEWIKETLKHRKLVSGQYRADPRLDVLDKVTVINKYAQNTVIITDIKYEYSGSFKGSYEGRVIDD